MKHPRIFIILILSIFLSQIAYAAIPTYLLKGSVTDQQGEPMIGVTILIKGAGTGTVTDFDGQFSLNVSNGNTLLFSSIGYSSREVVIKDQQNNLKIVMKEDAQNLDEVVVIGYGTQKKSSLTSSIETVKKEDLLMVPTANLDQALVGQVSGMHVRASTGDPSSAKEADIRIRGIQGSPLLVIDGIPRFGNNTSDGEMRLSDLNPDDIESISILKDAAAAAVYGARAANGVILVKTKRGTNEEKVKVNYRGQFNLTQATHMPEFLDSYNFALLYNQAIANTPGTKLQPYNEEQLNQIKNQTNPNVYANENLQDHLNKFGYMTTHSLSVAGGSKSVRYYVSGGYTNTKGLYGGVGRDRYNYAVKLDADLMKGLSMQIDLTGTRSANKNTSYATLDAAYNFSPIQPLRFTNGELASINGSNPLISVEGLGGYVRNNMNFNTLSANLNYEFQKVKGLSVYGRVTIDENNQVVKTFSTPTTLYTYTKEYIDNVPVEIFKEDANTVYPKAKITLEERDQFVKNLLLEAGVNYNRTFQEDHNVTGLFVYSYQDYNNRYLGGKNEDMPGSYPEIMGNNITGKITGGEYYSQRASLIGRLTYGYKNRYYAETSFRTDASTRFHPDNRWGFFPTVSASWVVSNEPFFQAINQHVISNLKLRGSTGILGRDGGIGDYSYLLNYVYNLRNNGYQIGESYRPGIIIDTANSFPNPDLKMEKSRDYNVAVDMGLFSNRFGFTFEHYWRYRTDLITTAPTYLFPSSTGIDYNLPNVNFGKIKAWGWDMTVNYRDGIGKFKYDLSLLLSKTDDIVLDYGDESSVPASQRRKGRRSTLSLLYQADGIFQNQAEIDALEYDQDGFNNTTLAPGDIKYVDRNDDGVISKDDRYMVRNSSQPDLSMGLNVNLRYKSIILGARFQGVFGYVQQISDIYTLENSSLQRFQQYHLTDTWSEDNRDARYPRLKIAPASDNNRKASTFWQQDCDFLRLKTLTLGYNFSAAMLRKMKISTLTVSLQGSNLFTISSLKGMDPESLRGYPIQRTYGVSLNFGL